MKIVLTGGDGFLGKSLVEGLPEHHFEIVDIKRKIDVTDELDMKYKVDWENADCVIHLAALTNPVDCYRMPKEDELVNIRGGLNVLMASLNVPQFIFASSCAVYGDNDRQMAENDNCNPVSPYGVSKLAMEKYIQVYRKEAIILRLANVFGPLDYKYLMYRLFHDEPFVLYGRGDMIREFLYIDDFINLMRQIIANGPTGGVDVFNVGGYQATVANVLAEVRRYKKTKGHVNEPDKRPGEMSIVSLDSSKVQETFSWFPRINIREGVKRLALAWSKKRTQID